MPGERYGCAGVVRSQPGWLGGTEENRQRGSTSEGGGRGGGGDKGQGGKMDRESEREKGGRGNEKRGENRIDGMHSPSMRGWTKQVLGSPTRYMEPS